MWSPSVSLPTFRIQIENVSILWRKCYWRSWYWSGAVGTAELEPSPWLFSPLKILQSCSKSWISSVSLENIRVVRCAIIRRLSCCESSFSVVVVHAFVILPCWKSDDTRRNDSQDRGDNGGRGVFYMLKPNKKIFVVPLYVNVLSHTIETSSHCLALYRSTVVLSHTDCNEIEETAATCILKEEKRPKLEEIFWKDISRFKFSVHHHQHLIESTQKTNSSDVIKGIGLRRIIVVSRKCWCVLLKNSSDFDGVERSCDHKVCDHQNISKDTKKYGFLDKKYSILFVFCFIDRIFVHFCWVEQIRCLFSLATLAADWLSNRRWINLLERLGFQGYPCYIAFSDSTLICDGVEDAISSMKICQQGANQSTWTKPSNLRNRASDM